MRSIFPFVLASLAPWACSQSSDFSGGAKRTAAEQAACDADAETVAELLTPEVKNGDDDNKIEYRISVTNCDGEKIKLEAKKILFDVEGISDKAKSEEALDFVAEAGETRLEGSLEKIRGEDLFGNTGDNYYHNATDKTLTLPEGTTEILFTIMLGGASHKPLQQNGEGSEDNLLPTYLAFGEAKVVRKDVHFLGKYPEAKK